MGKKEGANAVRTLMLIDATTGKRTPCTAARAAGGLAWSSDGKVLALAVTAADGKPMIRLSDATADKLIREWETPEAATRLIFTVDGRTILSQGQGGIHLWNATTGQLIREVRKAMGGGIEVRMSGDGTFIALKSFGGAVEVLDWEAERVLTNGDGVGNWYPFALAPDGTTLATAGDRGLLLWPVPGPTD
jgi:WD40 repeat protein